MNILHRAKIMHEMYQYAIWGGVVEFLSNFENWTPTLIYVRMSRLAIGFFFGTFFGIIVSIFAYIIK